ncbi:MAG: sodium:solute symporter family protein [Clostridia bacterium]|nr:sodium:solute symporter family protein [Clostridia bacterium]
MDAAILVLYLAALVAVGLSGGKAKDLGGFSRAEPGLFALIATLSAGFIGGGFSSGNAAACAAGGIMPALILCGFTLGWLVLGLLLPRMHFPKGATTAGEVMGYAYGEGARVATGIFSFLLSAGILGAQIGVMGSLFETFLGLPRLWGILLGTAAATVYSTFGGLGAVIRADVVQFCILFIGMPVLTLLSLRAGGGISSVPTEAWELRLTPAVFSAFLAMALGELLSPPGLQRLLGGDRRKASRAVLLSAALSAPFFLITGLVGLMAAKLLPSAELPHAMESMILLVAPAGIRGLILAALFSAVLSTADSFQVSASVGLVSDVLKSFCPGLTGQHALRAVRKANVLTGAAAAAVAFFIPSVLDAVTFAYTFWSPVLLVPLAAALLDISAPPRAATGAMLGGAGSVFLWRFLLSEPLGISAVPVGFLVSLAVFSLLRPHRFS